MYKKQTTNFKRCQLVCSYWLEACIRRSINHLIIMTTYVSGTSSDSLKCCIERNAREMIGYVEKRWDFPNKQNNLF